MDYLNVVKNLIVAIYNEDYCEIQEIGDILYNLGYNQIEIQESEVDICAELDKDLESMIEDWEEDEFEEDF